MKEKLKVYRQGEIYLKGIDSLPEGLKLKSNVLAEGETTGHMHQFKSNSVKTYTNNNGTQYCVLEEEATLTHEEHNPITLEKGVYEVWVQREYDPLVGVRAVTD